MVVSRKNLIFIFAGLIVLVALTLTIIANFRKTIPAEKENVSETGGAVPSLPGGEPLAESVSPDEIKKSVQEGLNATQKNKDQILKKIYRDNSGRQISLNDFVGANGIKIETGVLQGSSQKDYATYSCVAEKGARPAVGIMLQQRRDVDASKYQQMFSEMEKSMGKWEKTIFADLVPLFFPGETFRDVPKFNSSDYATSNKANTVKVRFANLTSVSGNSYSIDWGFLNDNLLIGNDKNCLRKMFDQNADAYEP